MILRLTFTDDDAFKPSLIIQAQGIQVEITRTRWIQFLALLIYRRLTGLDNGWATLEDIQRLLAFQKTKQTAIGKYITSSYFDLQPEVGDFFKNYLYLSTTGPYTLMLDNESIHTDLKLLTQYLKWITAIPVNEKTDVESLWEIAKPMYRKHNYSSYQNILKNFIKAAINDRRLPDWCVPYAFIRLADTEIICRSNVVDFKSAILNAKRFSSDLEKESWRKILYADANDIESINIDGSTRSVRQFTKLNSESINLLQSLPESNNSKLNVLVKPYSNAFYVELYTSGHFNRKLFNKTLELSRHLQAHVFMKHFELKSILIQRFNSKEGASASEIGCYEELLREDSISTLKTFDHGNMIWRSLVNARRFEEAYYFGQECLIHHAELFETARYRQLTTNQKKLKNILG